MINQNKFVEKWERQRGLGPWIYGLMHGAFIGGTIAILYFLLPVMGLQAFEKFTPRMVWLFAIGGFAYGLLRFNIRERVYSAIKGHEDDGS